MQRCAKWQYSWSNIALIYSASFWTSWLNNWYCQSKTYFITIVNSRCFTFLTLTYNIYVLTVTGQHFLCIYFDTNFMYICRCFCPFACIDVHVCLCARPTLLMCQNLVEDSHRICGYQSRKLACTWSENIILNVCTALIKGNPGDSRDFEHYLLYFIQNTVYVLADELIGCQNLYFSKQSPAGSVFLMSKLACLDL